MSFAPSTYNSTGSYVSHERKRSFLSKFWERFPWYLPALIAIGMGCVLLQPIDTFAQSPAWRIMGGMFGHHSETIWALVFLLSGVTHIMAKVLDLRFKPATAILLSGLYGLVAGTLYASTGLLSPGTIVYSGVAALAVWTTPRR